MKTRKYDPEEYSRRLTRTFLGVGPSKGGLSVPELKTGLNSLLRSYKTIKKTRGESINCYNTARSLDGVKVSSLKKQELLAHLKPYRRYINQTKVEIGIAPADGMEKKVLRLEKDPKLKYKAQAYKAADWSTNNDTVISDLVEAVIRIEERRQTYGMPSLPSELLDLIPHYLEEREKERQQGLDFVNRLEGDGNPADYLFERPRPMIVVERRQRPVNQF